MKKMILFAGFALFSAAVFAAGTNLPPVPAGAKYTAAIEGRTADILKILALDDTNKVSKVHDIIIAQYRALNAWHDANDPRLKAVRADTNAVAQIRASLKTLHDGFISRLSAVLTPEQVDQVKDKMTYNKVAFTFAGYCAAYSNLTGEQKQKIVELLDQAREEAMDGGSAAEKTAIFQRYKGKINNYLSRQGVHPEKQKIMSLTNSATQ